MSGNVAEFTDSNFQSEVLDSAEPVLVDFWAPWCGPCRMQGPILEQLAASVGDKAVIAKVNVDDEPELASRFGVSSIPTLVVMKQGQVVRRMVGVQPGKLLAAALQTAGA